MAENHIAFYTKTMAKLYADQGHWEKAADIYRYLLSREPDRRDLIDALYELENRKADWKETPSEKLISLFAEWIDLMLVYKKLCKLRKLER